MKNDVLSVNAAEVSAEREYEKGTGAKKRPASVSGIVTGDATVSYWSIIFPTTVPEVSAKGPRKGREGAYYVRRKDQRAGVRCLLHTVFS